MISKIDWGPTRFEKPEKVREFDYGNQGLEKVWNLIGL